MEQKESEASQLGDLLVDNLLNFAGTPKVQVAYIYMYIHVRRYIQCTYVCIIVLVTCYTCRLNANLEPVQPLYRVCATLLHGHSFLRAAMESHIHIRIAGFKAG